MTDQLTGRDSRMVLLAEAFLLLQGMEIVWHEERGETDNWEESMSRYAKRAYDLWHRIEPVLNAAGIKTCWSSEDIANG
jgi:hypothetical protein